MDYINVMNKLEELLENVTWSLTETDYLNFKIVWDAAKAEAAQIAMDYHISQVGRNNAGLIIANKIEDLK